MSELIVITVFLLTVDPMCVLVFRSICRLSVLQPSDGLLERQNIYSFKYLTSMHLFIFLGGGGAESPTYQAANTYAQLHHLHLPFHQQLRAFVVAAASVWNKLPQEIRSATSLPVFRRRLKAHLFDCV